MKFKGENLKINGNLDWNDVQQNAYYLLYNAWNYGSVSQIRYVGDKWLDEIHESWFKCADKGSAGCWIANENGNIIAQIAYYGKGEGYVVAEAKNTGDHWLGQ